jgi:nucleotide-binding universal stress UspA family protein
MNVQVGKILFPTDFSQGSEISAPYALDLAGHYGARIYIMHVIYDITRASALYVTSINTDALYEEMEASARQELEQFAGRHFGAYEDRELVLLRGNPYEDIIRYAGEGGIDLIVMSSHGRRGLDRVLFGSTASKVVKNAPCPVLTVRIPS